MAPTRAHPKGFAETDSSSSKQASASTTTRGRKSSKWAHSPSNLTVIWLLISLPLIAWDTGYVLLRPHSMPGGWLHEPIWAPYELYGKIDYVYGWKAFNEHNGFTAAQATMNIFESLCYIYYLYVVFTHGTLSAAGGRRRLAGNMSGAAVLALFGGALMTLSKTVLYALNEYFSGFENVGHNDIWTLIPLWIIPNGAWILLPAYMVYVSGPEILQGLAIAAAETDGSSK